LAGIYIHVPFCRHKCPYCNFFSPATTKYRDPFLSALKKEIQRRRDYLEGEPVNTIYFGGGTPSLYRPGVLQEIIEMLMACNAFPDSASVENPLAPVTHSPVSKKEASPISTPPREMAKNIREITIEINPEDVTGPFVNELKHSSFNRFSVGIQSFSDNELVWLKRPHTAHQAIQAVRKLQEAGFENISIDLIYGIPNSTTTSWQQNLKTAFSLNVPHISAYALTIEPGTPLAWMVKNKKTQAVDEKVQVSQFKRLMKTARDHGFYQYEISNFSLPEKHSLHNTNYWMSIPYLGLGPSAHSYNGKSRRWNVSSISGYLELLNTGNCFYEEETLAPAQKYNEYVMTSLRTMWGCDRQKILSEFGAPFYESFMKSMEPLINKAFLKESQGIYCLTDKGKLFADGVAATLFVVPPL